MSQTGPNAFVVVGDTDWIDPSRRTVDMAYDSRLRRARRLTTAGAWRSAIFAARKAAGALSFYAEFSPTAMLSAASGSVIFGVCSEAAAASVTGNAAGLVSGSVGYSAAGDTRIYKDGSTDQNTGIGFTVGDRVGVELYDDAGTQKVRWYKNGIGVGSPVAQSGTVSLVASCYYTDESFASYLDAHELRYLPTGAQPWGAAAMIADRSVDALGYSPAATIFTDADADFPIDTFGRITTGTTTNDGLAICNRAPNLIRRSGLYYCEVLIETDTGTLGLIGLAPRNTSTGTRYPGFTADTWGYYGSNGDKYNNGAAAAYGAALSAGDRLGMLWEPSTGKLYWAINGTVQNSGDPEAGTGAAFTTATGDLVPAVTPYQGRFRLCTHAREQLYRPSYATAWDGADILPEQFYADRLTAAPTVRRAVSFTPWADRGGRGAPIGAVELLNADGEFDALTEWELRDQAVVAYVQDSDGLTRREWTGVVDSVEHPNADTCRVLVGDVTAKLDVRVDSPVFALGNPELIPTFSRLGSDIAKDVAQSGLGNFDVYDQALAVTTWQRSDVDGLAGFERTVNPAGLQSVRNLVMAPAGAAVTISNGDFSAWTAGVPDNWSVALFPDGLGGVATVTQSGNAAVITTTGTSVAYLYHAAPQVTGTYYALVFTVTAASNPNYVTVEQADSAGGLASSLGPLFVNNIGGTGTFSVVYEATDSGSGDFNGFAIACSGVSSVTIDKVELFETQLTRTLPQILETIFEYYGGFSADQWAFVDQQQPYDALSYFGYWSDQRPTLRQVLSEVCDSVNVDYYTDADGVVRFAWLYPPEEVIFTDPIYAGEITEAECFADLVVTDDYAPNLSTVAEFQRNYIPHNDGDIAGAVSVADRQYFTSERKENKLDLSGSIAADDAGPLHPFYSFANDAPVIPRLLVNELVDTNTPTPNSLTVDNGLILLHRCYASRRRFYTTSITREKAAALAINPGDVVELTHRRYGLSGGKNLMVTAVESNLASPNVNLTLWG